MPGDIANTAYYLVGPIGKPMRRMQIQVDQVVAAYMGDIKQQKNLCLRYRAATGTILHWGFESNCIEIKLDIDQSRPASVQDEYAKYAKPKGRPRKVG